MSDAAVWTITVGALVCILLAILFLTNFVLELRSLAMQGVPRPWFVMYCRTVGRFIPGRTDPIESLVGRMAFLSWDIRWLTSGNTMAKVIAVNEIGNELMLGLDQPIVIHATENAPALCLEQVQFKPRQSFLSLYGKQAVSGMFFSGGSDALSGTASVVVYPS